MLSVLSGSKEAVKNDLMRSFAPIKRIHEFISTCAAIHAAGLLSRVALLALTLTSTSARADGFDMDLDKGMEYRSRNDSFTFSLGGRRHYDGADFQADNTRLEDNWSTRRLRLSLSMNVLDDWRVGAQYDLLDEREPWELLWLRYGGYARLFITAGQFPEPFGLEHLTSSNAITFLERALPTALTPGTHVGIAISSRAARWSGTLGVFRQTYIADDDRFAASAGGGLTGRITGSFLDARRRLLHLGTSMSLRNPNEDNWVRFRASPESDIANVRLIDTERINDVKYFISGGLEVAYVSGPWSLQGEYFNTQVYRQSNLDSAAFHGGYAYASLFLTGERRRYSATRGTFNAIRPKRSYGAWEIAVRRSYLDLNGRTVFGGREDNITWGINWYPHRILRLMFNYIHVNTDAYADDNDFDILQVRFQIAI